MMIDAATRESLEITLSAGGSRAGSLLASVDRTVTGAARGCLPPISARRCSTGGRSRRGSTSSPCSSATPWAARRSGGS
jgi:hypothetical protein